MLNQNNGNELFKYESEIFEIKIGDSNRPLTWRIGSVTQVPDVGSVEVTRIYTDTASYILNGFAKVIVVGRPIDSSSDFEFNVREYPASFCCITTNAKHELERLGYFDTE